MNANQNQTIAIRAASILASLAVTALILASQLGIADGYTRQAAAALAANNARQPSTQQPIAQHTAPAPRQRS